MRRFFHNFWFKAVILVLVFSAGFEVNALFFTTKITPVITNLRQQNSPYKYIDPLLLCRISGIPNPPQLEKLKMKINEQIAAAKPQVQSVSVVFRDLEKSSAFGINQNDQYAPASLLKVPLMIAYLKAFESDPTLLGKKLTMNNALDTSKNQNYKPEQSIKAGEAHTIEELINYMITYSDNNAMNLLAASLKPEQQNLVYTDLGLTIPPQSATVEFMSARLYSYFFRVLYNATYLSPQLSEKAMDLLTKAHFPDGIESGVPKNVPIAQKFGEREVQDSNRKVLYNELHSCGVIYYPGNPYLLCIMTKGDNFADLSKLIQGISKTVYEEFDSENGKKA